MHEIIHMKKLKEKRMKQEDQRDGSLVNTILLLVEYQSTRVQIPVPRLGSSPVSETPAPRGSDAPMGTGKENKYKENKSKREKKDKGLIFEKLKMTVKTEKQIPGK